jgi:hypothetical protein
MNEKTDEKISNIIIPQEAELACLGGGLNDKDNAMRDRLIAQRKKILEEGIASIEKRKKLEPYFNELMKKINDNG